ncbi:hypothetical protein QAO71_10615 [Halopseudomonas sp. SMJS2]|uniref:hypothetical protein n=1 Tax=Halopseudomonas sp. SMJS2 TaxID=3041098 RepID=UPI002453086E|nr:hypothetical protein [Halopseudomonas sp. SMJS2]WGK60545.1 hypothetical protein QAO71_10615 [Halopseudomonas sp. SMJS2]
MTHLIEQRLVEVAKDYANQRTRLRKNREAIRKLHGEADGYIDLSPYRERYLGGEVTDDPECSIVWRGWLHAVDECQAWDGVEFDEDCGYRAMAILLDERKAIRADGSKIRNRLRVAGGQLLRAES